MHSADLYIVAAGNGSRLNCGMPKALMPIIDEPCITTTLREIGPKFRKVFVVTNALALDEWSRYFDCLEVAHPELATNTENLPIRSGFGDGHATLQALTAVERISADSLPDDVVVTWGDAFYRHPEIIDELLRQPLRTAGLFPAVYESNPYVSLLVDDNMHCIAADFSKHSESHAAGFHDQSVFRFLRSRLARSLRELHSSLWKNGRYVTPGGELSLLYTAHQLYNVGEPVCVYETRHPTCSFNTLHEVMAIQREMGVVTDASGVYTERS